MPRRGHRRAAALNACRTLAARATSPRRGARLGDQPRRRVQRAHRAQRRSQQRVIQQALRRRPHRRPTSTRLRRTAPGPRSAIRSRPSALQAVYGPDRDQQRPLLLGSVKSNIVAHPVGRGRGRRDQDGAGAARTAPATADPARGRAFASHVDWTPDTIRLLTEPVDLAPAAGRGAARGLRLRHQRDERARDPGGGALGDEAHRGDIAEGASTGRRRSQRRGWRSLTPARDAGPPRGERGPVGAVARSRTRCGPRPATSSPLHATRPALAPRRRRRTPWPRAGRPFEHRAVVTGAEPEDCSEGWPRWPRASSAARSGRGRGRRSAAGRSSSSSPARAPSGPGWAPGCSTSPWYSRSASANARSPCPPSSTGRLGRRARQVRARPAGSGGCRPAGLLRGNGLAGRPLAVPRVVPDAVDRPFAGRDRRRRRGGRAVAGGRRPRRDPAQSGDRRGLSGTGAMASVSRPAASCQSCWPRAATASRSPPSTAPARSWSPARRSAGWPGGRLVAEGVRARSIAVDYASHSAHVERCAAAADRVAPVPARPPCRSSPR